MLADILTLIGGVVLAWFGGEWFVRGSVNLATWARWPAAVVGATVAAFGTSSPELMVGINSAVEKVPQLSFGDVMGSNVVNVGLVLGIALCTARMEVARGVVRRDLTVVLLLPVLAGVLLWDGLFSRFDAAILLLLFVGWLVQLVRSARAFSAEQKAVPISEGPEESLRRSLGHTLIGLLLLFAASYLVVRGGKGIALALGWSEFVVGAVVVAVATSTPELATTLVARMRGHDDVSLGNILGSNIFNTAFIVGVVAMIRPFHMQVQEVMPSLIMGCATALLLLPTRSRLLGRRRGWILLGLYAIFVVWTLLHPGAAPAHDAALPGTGA